MNDAETYGIIIMMSKKILFIALLVGGSLAGSSAGAQTFPSNTSTVGFVFTQNLTVGIRGNDVSVLQQFLIAGGFLKISAPTGYFGPLTRTALGQWQASVGISPDAGFFGPISRGKINAMFQQAPIDVSEVQGMAATTTTAVGTTNAATSTNINGSPVRLKIPKLNIDAGVQYNGLKPDGTMEVPTNITDVGWFIGSPHPGEKGSAIITGHVAQIRGGVLTKPGVFSGLNALVAGDLLYVINDKGASTAFVVREIRNYDPTANATDVFTSGDSGAHLNLITCEGTWNASQLSYSQRLVVFTDAVQ
jgi:sortase (surface protein transpeptidase)